jgi:hypothetical protein
MNMKNWLSKNKVRWEAPGETPSGGLPPQSDPPPSGDPAPQIEGPDLSFIPENFHVDGKPDLEKFKEHYGKLVEPSVAPEKYDYLIPEDLNYQELGLPEGMKMNFDLEDPAMQPILGELSAALKEIGAPAEMGGKIGGLLAKYEASKLGAQIAAQVKEFEQLGTKEQANERISAVVRAMEAKLPADQVEALQGVTKSAKAMMAMEKLLGPRHSTTPTEEPGSSADDDGYSSRYPTSRTK